MLFYLGFSCLLSACKSIPSADIVLWHILDSTFNKVQWEAISSKQLLVNLLLSPRGLWSLGWKDKAYFLFFLPSYEDWTSSSKPLWLPIENHVTSWVHEDGNLLSVFHCVSQTKSHHSFLGMNHPSASPKFKRPHVIGLIQDCLVENEVYF